MKERWKLMIIISAQIFFPGLKHNALLSGFSFKMSDGNRRLNKPKFFKEVSSCKTFKKFLKPV